jgi:hypothetical protein
VFSRRWLFYDYDIEQPVFPTGFTYEYFTKKILNMKLLDEAHKMSSQDFRISLILVRTIEPEEVTIILNLNMFEYPVNFDLLC